MLAMSTACTVARRARSALWSSCSASSDRTTCSSPGKSRATRFRRDANRPKSRQQSAANWSAVCACM
eukprot:6412193-Alexandrium_andersonii.AAC.1